MNIEFMVASGLLLSLLSGWCFYLLRVNAAQRERVRELEEAAQQQGLVLERQGADLDNLKMTHETLSRRFEEASEKAEQLSSQYHIAERQIHSKEAELKSTIQAREELSGRLSQLDANFQTTLEENTSLKTKQASLKASLEERDEHHKEQVAQFAEQKKALEKEFENLANRIFEEKGKAFNHTNKESLELLLKPFREQITEFRQRVDHLQKENSESTGSLRKELEQLRELNQKMTSDAQNLTDALKGDKKKVGSWGEIQLERTLQIAGLIKGDHYESQVHFKDETGKNNYPDFVVKLPDDKHIVIDSKVSLVDYDTAISANNEEELNEALDRHCKAVKQHIDSLSDKDYSNLIGMKSPSFVLMFMPIEPAYIEAMRHNKDLFNYGYQKGVVMVSHTTLMPILRTVANLWMIERSNAEAKAISDKAGDVFNQVCLVAERLKSLGASLMQASKHYNSVAVGLAGQQGLHGKVERFSQLSNKVSKSMPAIETMHMDIDVDRLEVIALENQDQENNSESELEKLLEK